jgi:Outer membrane protein beta-barrel domain
MKNKMIVFCLVFINSIFAQTELKNYLNTGFGLYVPTNSNSNSDDIGNTATLNLEVELTKRSISRFSIDTYRIPLLKETNFNNTTVKSNTKANITSLGLDYGMHFVHNKWRFYTFVGGSVCFIDEPEFSSSNNSNLVIDSKNVTRFAVRVSPGIKYHFTDTFILFAELQNLSVFYKNTEGKNLLNGGGLVFGIASKI